MLGQWVPRPWEEGGLVSLLVVGGGLRRGGARAPDGGLLRLVGGLGQEAGLAHTLRGWYRLAILAFFLMLTMVISNLSSKVCLLPAGESPGGLIWSVTP